MPLPVKEIDSKKLPNQYSGWRVLFFVSFVLISFASCRKDPQLNSCTPIPDWTGVGFGYNYHLSSEYYEMPEFNPNNSDEIVFCEGDKLYKFDLSNNVKSVIFEGTLYAQPSWGVNDWILLSRSDNNIWKIKASGDSLTQLTFDGNSSYAKWNFDGSKYFYVASGTYGGGLVLRNANNSVIDTIKNGAGGTWKNNADGLIVDAAPMVKVDENNWKQGVEIVDPLEDKIIYTYYLQTTSEFFSASGEVWLGDKFSVVWSCAQGVFRTNYFTNTTNKLADGCNGRYYMEPSYSPGSDRIIWQRVDRTLLDENTVFVESRLVLMNSDGTNEQVVEIPQ